HGSMVQAVRLLQRSEGGQVLNTSYIERLNGTVRERLATLTRKCRHAAHRLQALETGMYADWEHLQLLLFPSRTQPTNSGRSSEATQTDARDGQWSD
ncbi:MAG TPA: hypothetical protein VIY29_00995, partial [Ktedonobacteraceae bacterium]